jgi:hypothetical protein
VTILPVGPHDVVLVPMKLIVSRCTSTEANLAQNADSYSAGTHAGYDPNAYEGICMSLEPAAKSNIKIIVNGGALNPEGLARKIAHEVCKVHPCRSSRRILTPPPR